jgi:hypothetical protein
VLTGAVFAYGLLASFILSCLQRTHREQRRPTPTLAIAGWGLMSASFAMTVLLLMLAAQMSFLR